MFSFQLGFEKPIYFLLNISLCFIVLTYEEPSTKNSSFRFLNMEWSNLEKRETISQK